MGCSIKIRKVPEGTYPVPQAALSKPHHPKPGSTAFQNPWPSWRQIPQEVIKDNFKQRDWRNTWKHASTKKVKVREHFPSVRRVRRRKASSYIRQFQVPTPTFSDQRSALDPSVLQATWLGHASYLVECPSGLRVLFDPVFEERCSPLRWLGPRRFTEAPCQAKDLPIIDLVVISHNHYDHLSQRTITEIASKQSHTHFFVPLGNASWFRSCGVKQVTELDWWEQAEITLVDEERLDAGTNITATVSCLPSQHTTGRGPFGTDKTLWASWAVKSASSSVYFAGDTGYRSVPWLKEEQHRDWDEEFSHLPVCPAFAEIGEMYGPFTLGLLPIGAYEPRAMLSSIHANPRDAVGIFTDTKCKRALAMHWGTWVLGDEDVTEPPRELAAALASVGIAKKGVFDICEIGVTVKIIV